MSRVYSCTNAIVLRRQDDSRRTNFGCNEQNGRCGQGLRLRQQSEQRHGCQFADVAGCEPDMALAAARCAGYRSTNGSATPCFKIWTLILAPRVPKCQRKQGANLPNAQYPFIFRHTELAPGFSEIKKQNNYFHFICLQLKTQRPKISLPVQKHPPANHNG